jgi:hypothetical protein
MMVMTLPWKYVVFEVLTISKDCFRSRLLQQGNAKRSIIMGSLKAIVLSSMSNLRGCEMVCIKLDKKKLQ